VLFVGAFERQLDDKGRLALPAPLRIHLGEHCYLAKGPDKSVHVVPAATFEAEAAAMSARAQAGEISRHEVRALGWSASLVSLDRQGRINIDEALRTYADLTTEGPVIVSGSFDRLEIWAPDRFAQVNDAGTLRMAGSEFPARPVE
jgi:MraZ protein